MSDAAKIRKPGHYWVRDEAGWTVAVWEELAGIWGWAYPGSERPLNDDSFDEIRETPIDPPA